MRMAGPAIHLRSRALFLYFALILGVLLWSGALAGALVGGARLRRSNQGKWRFQ